MVFLETVRTKIGLSVVIPCYNEQNRLQQTVIELVKFFFRNRETFDYEIIFVDDGSKDNTLSILIDFEKRFSHVKWRSYTENKGKGYAVRQGLLSAKYENVLILDADLSVKPDNLLRIMQMYSPFADTTYIVIGKRIQVLPQPLYRQVVGWGFRGLVYLFFQSPFQDSQCPFTFLHKVQKQFASELKIDGFAYDVELIHKAQKSRIPIYETAVQYFNDAESKVTLKKAIKMFFELLRIRFL